MCLTAAIFLVCRRLQSTVVGKVEAGKPQQEKAK